MIGHYLSNNNKIVTASKPKHFRELNRAGPACQMAVPTGGGSKGLDLTWQSTTGSLPAPSRSFFPCPVPARLFLVLLEAVRLVLYWLVSAYFDLFSLTEYYSFYQPYTIYTISPTLPSPGLRCAARYRRSPAAAREPEPEPSKAS